ncbi:hypothetical protein [Anaerococcus porci]|uniref:Uncharacterized protein n=1 Tax=Anaerococcus porci TaxID=2652269 RepID=A0A6N7VU34_9FIRM|nr:hypothetical protein [Anaerococcus porci]MDY3006039.1 hypothetical protein [Anaerococcus porci]MSS77564.1 hypothetical protein [Anaerococcus porci]
MHSIRNFHQSHPYIFIIIEIFVVLILSTLLEIFLVGFIGEDFIRKHPYIANLLSLIIVLMLALGINFLLLGYINDKFYFVVIALLANNILETKRKLDRRN